MDGSRDDVGPATWPENATDRASTTAKSRWPMGHHRTMPSPDLSVSRRLVDHLDSAPTPYHAVARATTLLEAGGFVEVAETDALPSGPGARFIRRGGALVAWRTTPDADPTAGWRLIGAHTDSPNLRIKPRPDTRQGRWAQLGVEVYGGVLLNSWLDRDLGLAGRVAVRDQTGVALRLFRDDRPALRIPQLAIHLDADIREKGLLLDAQRHLGPVWGLGDDVPSFREHLGALVGAPADDIVAWEAMTHDVTPATLAGHDDCFLVSGRIDNLLSCFLAIEALVAASPGPHSPMIALFDHEEVGSVSAQGAASPLLGRLLDRIETAAGADLEGRARSRAATTMLSADGAHATHPNYADRHEPAHHITLDGGPVLKINSNQRYATDAESAAAFVMACEAAEVPYQQFVNRTDLACGSTIGPATAGELGISVVDAGCAQLAMHSAREMCGSGDPGRFLGAMTAFLSG